MSVLFLNVNIKGNDQLSNALDKMNNAAKKLNDGIKDTQKHLASLSKMQLKVSSFEKLKQETSDAQKKLESYKKTAEALKQQLAAGGKNPELTNQLKTIEKEAKKLQGTVDKNTPALKKMRQELNKAGLSGMSMADAQRKLKEDIEATTTAISKQQTQLEKFNKAQDHYDKMKGISNKAAGVAGWTSKALITGGSALAIPVKIAIDAEKSMADVAKVVDGLKVDGKVTQEYHQFEAQLTQMSNRLGKSFGDLAAIMAGGAQGGIAKTELLAFTEAATKISIAWDMTASDVGQALAELRSTLKMSQSEVQGLADQINYLGNNSTNNAKYILEVVQYSGSVGAAAGVAGEQIAAMAASLSGIDASSASTGIKNIIKSLTKGKSATKSQQKAWQELGTTAEQMAVEMLKDPQKAIENYLQMLGKLPEEQRLAFAAMISGDEALPVLSQMMNDPTKFSQYAADIKDKNKVGGSVDEEYNSATSTTAHQLERAKVKLQNFGKDFGKYLLPVVGKIADGFSAILDRVSAWMIANPQLAKYLAMAAVGVMAILAGVTVVAGAMALLVMPFAWLNLMIAKASFGALSLGGIFKGLLSPVSSLKTAFGAIKTFAVGSFGKLVALLAKFSSLFGTLAKSLLRFGGLLGRLAVWLNPLRLLPAMMAGAKAAFIMLKAAAMVAVGGIKAFGVALLTNPITWAVAAIAGLAFVIYKYWNPIKAFLAGVWDGIKTKAAPLISTFNEIGSAISPVIDWFKNLFRITQVGEGRARSLGQAFGSGLVAVFNAVTTPIQTTWRLLKWLWDSISGLFSGQISVGDIFADLWAKFDGVVAKIKEWKDKAAKLWDDFWGVFKSKQSETGTAESGVGSGFWSSLANGFETAKNTISEKAGGMWESAKAKFDTAKTTLSTKAGEIWSSVTNVISGSSGADIGITINAKVQAILIAIATAAATISATFIGLIGVVSASVIGIITVIGSAFASIPVIVAAAMAGVPAVFAASLSTLPAITASVFSALAVAVGAGMAVMATVVSARMMAVVNVIRAGFARIRQVVATAWRQLGSAMSGNPILAKIQAAMNATLAYLNGIKGRFFAIGADIVDGLDAGMNSRLGVLRKTAAQMAAVVEDASRKRLDTHSPSRVMMAVGRDVVAGLDVGMGRRFVPMLKNFRANVGRLASPENVARITKAMDGIGRATGSDDVAGDLVRMVAPALGKNRLLGHLLDISVSGLSAYAKYQTTPTPKPVSIKPVSSAPAMMANAVSSQSMNTTSNFTIHIHADKGMDERSLAQKVRAELERCEQTKAARYRARLTD